MVAGWISDGIGKSIWALARHPGARRLLERLAQEIDEAVEDRTGTGSTRSLYQMRLSRPPTKVVEPLATMPYRPGVDDAALLGVLQAAFAWHPEEQWDQSRLQAESAAAGFQPSDVLLARSEGQVVGCCWTKVHTGGEAPRGEIVIAGVRPEHAGKGFGTRMVAAGLDHLWDQGMDWVYLYVESSNLRAVRAYLRLGFSVYRTEHRFGEPPLVIP